LMPKGEKFGGVMHVFRGNQLFACIWNSWTHALHLPV
jgi:hypothetical protein